MKSTFLSLIVLFATSCNMGSESNNNINNTYKTIVVKTNDFIDLKICVSEHLYPPHLPKNLFWAFPDTTNWTDKAKQNLVFKYRFDKTGKLQEYYYRGSVISAIFPLKNIFKYAPDNSELITEIIDPLYKSKYLIYYHHDNSIKQIEKLDSTGKVVEAFEVTKK